MPDGVRRAVLRRAELGAAGVHHHQPGGRRGVRIRVHARRGRPRRSQVREAHRVLPVESPGRGRRSGSRRSPTPPTDGRRPNPRLTSVAVTRQRVQRPVTRPRPPVAERVASAGRRPPVPAPADLQRRLGNRGTTRLLARAAGETGAPVTPVRTTPPPLAATPSPEPAPGPAPAMAAVAPPDMAAGAPPGMAMAAGAPEAPSGAAPWLPGASVAGMVGGAAAPGGGEAGSRGERRSMVASPAATEAPAAAPEAAARRPRSGGRSARGRGGRRRRAGRRRARSGSGRGTRGPVGGGGGGAGRAGRRRSRPPAAGPPARRGAGGQRQRRRATAGGRAAALVGRAHGRRPSTPCRPGEVPRQSFKEALPPGDRRGHAEAAAPRTRPIASCPRAPPTRAPS